MPFHEQEVERECPENNQSECKRNSRCRADFSEHSTDGEQVNYERTEILREHVRPTEQGSSYCGSKHQIKISTTLPLQRYPTQNRNREQCHHSVQPRTTQIFPSQSISKPL